MRPPSAPTFRSALFVLLLATASPAPAADPFFQAKDVIAFVGGEDLVAAAESGYLEAEICQAYPAYELKFRSLAWEGDTVYEQRRDLNYPTLEQQLDKIGATVIFIRFGTMECFDGESVLDRYVEAYRKLLARLSSGGKRRMVVISPSLPGRSASLEKTRLLSKAPDSSERYEIARAYAMATRKLATDAGYPYVDQLDPGTDTADIQRDSIHLTDPGQWHLAEAIRTQLGVPATLEYRPGEWRSNLPRLSREEYLLRLIAEKNRLWFNYYRPQNWAFLAGDRTNQPSSRDHRDPAKRWFPEELEQFIPMIEKKESEIAAITTKGGAK